MSKIQPLTNHGYDREEAYFYEQEQKTIAKFRRQQRKKNERHKSLTSNQNQLEKKAA